MSDPYIGEIRMFGFNFAPTGWAMCNGQLLSIAQNQALFSLLGTTYGGDGIQTFGLPNLQGRVPKHFGNGAGLPPYVLGEIAGVETVTLLQQQMPIHNHVVNCSTGIGTQASPGNGFPAVESTGTSMNYAATTAGAVGTMSPTVLQNSGGSQPFSIVTPFQCVNFCIATVGIFPSRG